MYCNRFIILFTQIIHKNQTSTKNKTFLILQYSTLKSTVVQYNSWRFLHSSYITAAFTLASGPPGLEIKILCYCTLYSTVQ